MKSVKSTICIVPITIYKKFTMQIVQYEREKNIWTKKICLIVGNITYRLLSAPDETLKFGIDPKNGTITTTQILDRDEPANDKEKYLIVIATNHGRRDIDEHCSVKVTIKDINDNPPMFDKVVGIKKEKKNIPKSHLSY